MNKLEYLQYAIEHKLYKEKSWMISAFSLTTDATNEAIKNVENKNVIRLAGLPYCYLESSTKLTLITGVAKNQPVFSFREPIVATPSLCSNLSEKVETTIGRLFFNLICLVHAFGSKIPYQNSSIEISKIEGMLTDKLSDPPVGKEPRSPDKIYVDEYKTFVNSLLYLTNFTQLCVWALTEKLITPPPGIDQARKALLEKYGNDLSDPVDLANFEKELLAIDSQYLQNDPGGQFFQSGGKSRNIVRKKLFLTLGAESGLTEGRVRRPVVQSLRDGWTPKDMPALIESLRAGSYNRGKRTALGGELTKWLFRASTGLRITEEDCHTQLGQKVLLTKNNYRHYFNKYQIENEKIILIDSLEKAKSMIGKTIIVRSPAFCHTGDNNFCQVCLGKDISNNKDGLSLAIAEIGSMFLLMKMKQIHGKALTTSTIDLRSVLT